MRGWHRANVAWHGDLLPRTSNSTSALATSPKQSSRLVGAAGSADPQLLLRCSSGSDRNAQQSRTLGERYIAATRGICVCGLQTTAGCRPTSVVARHAACRPCPGFPSTQAVHVKHLKRPSFRADMRAPPRLYPLGNADVADLMSPPTPQVLSSVACGAWRPAFPSAHRGSFFF